MGSSLLKAVLKYALPSLADTLNYRLIVDTYYAFNINGVIRKSFLAIPSAGIIPIKKENVIMTPVYIYDL